MCGISGERRFGSRAPEIGTQLAMVGELQHRGPDGSGVYRDADVALGHARLTIIDAAGGTQPMSDESGDVWITFNGEIFNYLELADELRGLGHRFRTRSDTEVIVRAWLEWGMECFARFNGQWALAVWDRRTRHLVLSRDRAGILPLFHTRVGDRLLFASEPAALFTDPEVPRAFDPAGLQQTFTLWSTVAPRTAFRGVRQVAPGECVVFGQDGIEQVRRFARPDFPSAADELRSDIATSAEVVRETLIEATRLRFLRSDVPVAAYLSGGIDSAVTAGIISRYTDADLDTFSLRFADAEYDEGAYQQLVSERLGTRHHAITVSGSDIAAAFPAVVARAQTPLLRTAAAPMFLLSRHVSESGYRVVVTGEGADETLAGYDLFREAAVRRFWARDPQATVRSRAVDVLYPWMQRSPARAPAFARSFFSRNLDPDDPFLSHRPRWDSTAVLTGMLTEAYRAPGAGDPVAAVADLLPAEADSWHPLSRAQWLEMTTLLPGYLLSSQGDRMLMAHSVEGRFPFLDPRFEAAAAALPARHKLFGLDEKHVLKAAFADLVPPEVLRRPKQPYRAPDAAAFFGAATPEWLEQVVDPEAVTQAGVFRPEIVARLVAKCRSTGGSGLGNVDNMRLVAVLSTQLLHRDLIAGPPPGGREPAEPLVVVDRLDVMEAG
ncbi:asparagine synthase (glutamine-hydrolyzing) [Microbacterium sp. RD1]|uniref:asparagine synthase (glutamine-hydrolyzing) n=1 Tax=Microbacterium sp. RD1 TaxID=3457313 RepID=UPI003FA5AF34